MVIDVRWLAVAVLLSSCGADDGSCPGGCPSGEVCYLGACVPEGDGGDGGADDASAEEGEAGEAEDEASDDAEAEADGCGAGLTYCPPYSFVWPGGCTGTQADDLNCGTCGNGCGDGEDCVAGDCLCVETICNLDGVDHCTDLTIPAFCGDCATRCNFATEGCCVYGDGSEPACTREGYCSGEWRP
jgi:hypothetical protein